MMRNRLVDIRGLHVSFKNDGKELTAVDNISFYVEEKETLGIVGESGCGKSLTSLALMGLVPPNGIVRAEKILFEGEDLIHKSRDEMRMIRGNRMSMIFQEPMTSLNPVLTVGFQMIEVLTIHQGMNKRMAWEASVAMLDKVGIAAPERCMRSYPYEMSGGMRQRIMIAMALLCNPKLLIADEPTTALDVTIQAQILNLIKKLKDESAMSVILITHDLGVVAETCERVVVMYAGEIVETAQVGELFNNPLHPYTRGLMEAIPQLERSADRLNVIRGTVPSLSNMPVGCKFHPRCDSACEVCRNKRPPTVEHENHFVSCWLYADPSVEKGDEAS